MHATSRSALSAVIIVTPLRIQIHDCCAGVCRCRPQRRADFRPDTVGLHGEEVTSLLSKLISSVELSTTMARTNTQTPHHRTERPGALGWLRNSIAKQKVEPKLESVDCILHNVSGCI